MWVAPWYDGGSPITNYLISRYPDDGIFPIEIGPDVRSFNDTNVSRGSYYTYVVQAVNAHGASIGYGQEVTIPFEAPIGPASGLTAEIEGEYVTLNWTAPSEAGQMSLYYRVEYVDLDQAGVTEVRWCVTSELTDPCTFQFHRSWYVAGHDYLFRVVALSGGGDSVPSNEVVLRVAFVPTQISDVTMVWGDGWAEFSWANIDDGGSPITEFLLTTIQVGFEHSWYEGGNQTLISIVNRTLGADVFSWRDEGLTNGGIYLYSISAVNSVGKGEATGRQVSPGTPSAVRNLASTQVGGKVLLTWNAPENDGGAPLSHYLIRISRWTYGSYDVNGYRNVTAPGDALMYEDDGALPGYDYFYWVYPFNSLGGLGVYVANADCWVGPSYERPGMPTNFSVELGWNGQSYSLFFNLTMHSPGAAQYCRVYCYDEVSMVTLATLNLVVSYDGPIQSFIIPPQWIGITGGLRWHFYVSVINDVGEGPFSDEVVLDIQLPPDPPHELSATWGVSESTLSWSAPTSDGGLPILGYRVSRYHLNESDYSYEHWENFTVAPGVCTFTDTGLEPGLTLTYLVTAYNEKGEGMAASINVKPGSPMAVREFTATSGDGYVLLSWAAPVGDGGDAILGYHISWYDNTDSASGSATVPAGQTTYNHTATNGHTYSYWIKAFNQLGGDGVECGNVPFGQPSASPRAVLGLRAIWVSEGGNYSVLVSWDPLDADMQGAIVQIQKSGGFFCMMVLGTSGSESSLLDPMVSANDTFTYWARLSINGRDGQFCAPVRVTPGCPLDVPQAVMAVPGTGFVNLSWAAPAICPSNFSGYELYRSEGSATPVLLATLGPNVLQYNDTTVRSGTNYTYSVSAIGVVSGNFSGPVKVKAGGLLAESTSAGTVGFTWPLLVILLVGIVAAIAILIYAPWKKMTKVISSILVVAVAAIIVVAGSMMPAPTQNNQTASSELAYHAGDYFVYGLYAPNGIGTVTASLVRIGDTTMTWNFTYEIPGQEPITDQQTGPKNHTMGYATMLSNMTMGSMMGFMEVTSITNETLATQWGYITAERRHINSTFMGMEMAMDMWSAGEAILRMEFGMSMMGMEMRMVLIRLVDTNIPEMIGGVR
jgi:titin